MQHSNGCNFSKSQLLETRVVQVYPLYEALRHIGLRLKHVVDEAPQKDVIFEIDSDMSEDALVKVVQKLSSKFAQIDVIAADDELLHLVVGRLKNDLKATTVEERSGATTMTGTWSEYRRKSHDYSLTVGTLSYFMRAEFERDVRDVGERTRKASHWDTEPTFNHRVAVLYRTEAMLVGRGLLEAHPLDTVELQIAPLLCHIYRLVDLLDGDVLLVRMRTFIKKYTERFVHNLLDERIEAIIKSAKAAKSLIQGTHFGFVKIDGKNGLITTSAIEREHFAIRQFLQIHHRLPVSPLRVPILSRSPLHLLKAYRRTFGVFRRGGYEFLQWMPFIAQLKIDASRVYPLDLTVTPIFSVLASDTISEWIVKVDKLMGFVRKIPQRGARIVVCPSTAAMNQLWRYLKYSHDSLVATLTTVVCTGLTADLERVILGRNPRQMVAVLTTAAHFETWHTRYMSNMEAVTVFLGTPRSEQHYLHRAYRFARPVTNVITVPLEPGAHRTHKDSGFESDSSAGSSEDADARVLCYPAPAPAVDPANWPTLYIREMWGNRRWRAPMTCEEDAEYDKCVQWMRSKWKEELNKEKTSEQFDEWREEMMVEYREGKKED